MHIRCPHCRNAIEVVGREEFAEVTCPSCGSSFNLAPETESYLPKLRTIGHFQLLEQLGSGGFGTVYKARDTELDRYVAVKIPRRDQVEPENVEMFLREARATAQLRHPGIVAVHEVGREDGTLYIVSDYIQGATLADRLTTGPMAPREAAELLAQVADALHHAHEAGVIHRDLKPSNIMLAGDGKPFLLDFGLAKREAGEITMTVDGRVLGTAAYMSPEQARGEAHSVDRRTDVYSLGVILFQLLTGELPFRGNRAMLLTQVINDEPPSPRKLNGRIPRDLETITLKCLEKEPRRRYGTAEEVAAELRRWLDRKPIVARPISDVARLVRWGRRNPALASLISTCALLLLTVAIVSTSAYLQMASDAKAKLQLLTQKTQLATNNAKLAQAERLARLATERQLRVATAERLAAQSLGLMREQPVTATLLAIEAVHVTTTYNEPHSPSAENALRTALATIGGWPLGGHGGSAVEALLSPDGRWLAIRGQDNNAYVWDLNGHDQTNQAKILRGHEREIGRLALTADARWLVTTSSDGTLRVWDLHAPDPSEKPITLRVKDEFCQSIAIDPSGRWLAVVFYINTHAYLWDLHAARPEESLILLKHDGPVKCLAASPDGRWIASGGEANSLRLWDLHNMGPSASPIVLAGHRGSVKCLAFSPDGHTLISGSDDHTARIWDVRAAETMAKPKVLPGHEAQILCLAISHDGRWLATGSFDKTVRVWDLGSDDPTVRHKILRGHESAINCLGLSQDGRWLVTGSSDKTARVWDLKLAAPSVGHKVLRGHDGSVHSIAINPAGSRVITNGIDGHSRLWELTAPSQIAHPKQLPGKEASIVPPSVSDDGRWLATGSLIERAVRVWDLWSHDPATQPAFLGTGEENAPMCLSLSPDGRWLFMDPAEGNGCLWDLNNSNIDLPKMLPKLDSSTYRAAYSADSRWLATASVDKQVRVWNLQASEFVTPRNVIRTSQELVNYLALSRTGNILAAGSMDHTVQVWDLTTPNPDQTAKVIPNPNLHAELSTDGRLLYVGNQSVIEVWDVWSGKNPTLIRILRGLEQHVSCMTISKNGRRLAVGSLGGDACVWDLERTAAADEPIVIRDHRTLNAHRVSMSADGRWLAVGSADGTIRVWDLTASSIGASPTVLRGHSVGVDWLAFDPGGRWLISRGSDQTAKVWLIEPEDLCEVGAACAGRSLTTEERDSYEIPSPGPTTTNPTQRSPLPRILVNLPSEVLR